MARQPRSERSAERPERPPRARLFVALDLPAEARGRLAEWRDRALRGRDDLRPVPPESLHVTLVFLGSRPEAEIDAIAGALAAAVDGLPGALLRPLGVSGVPPRRPRLFALDLEDDGGRAGVVQAAVSDALEAGGFYRPEKRPFWPHVTLARVRRGVRAAPLAAEAPGQTFGATEVTLYRSFLRPTGAEYVSLAALDLASDERG